MKQCVRCGIHLRDNEKLRCRVCIEKVNEELKGEANRPFRYYFKRNLKHKK